MLRMILAGYFLILMSGLAASDVQQDFSMPEAACKGVLEATGEGCVVVKADIDIKAKVKNCQSVVGVPEEKKAELTKLACAQVQKMWRRFPNSEWPSLPITDVLYRFTFRLE